MDIRKISLHLSVSPQLQVGDLARISQLGFKTILNNRPDFETDDQPLAASLAEEAARRGLRYRDVPVVAGTLTDMNVSEFSEAMAELPGPVLAFCRTGTRSTTLWALACANHLDPDAILSTASSAGYDLEGLRSRLKEIAAG